MFINLNITTKTRIEELVDHDGYELVIKEEVEALNQNGIYYVLDMLGDDNDFSPAKNALEEVGRGYASRDRRFGWIKNRLPSSDALRDLKQVRVCFNDIGVAKEPIGGLRFPYVSDVLDTEIPRISDRRELSNIDFSSFVEEDGWMPPVFIRLDDDFVDAVHEQQEMDDLVYMASVDLDNDQIEILNQDDDLETLSKHDSAMKVQVARLAAHYS